MSDKISFSIKWTILPRRPWRIVINGTGGKLLREPEGNRKGYAFTFHTSQDALRFLKTSKGRRAAHAALESLNSSILKGVESERIILYHGTSKTKAIAAIKFGLRPRRDDVSNWKEYPSNDDMVYLTDTYPLFFAIATTKEYEEMAVMEVSVDMDNLYPDEDFIHQVYEMQELPKLKPLEAIRLQMCNKELWKMSLEKLGNVAHQGRISVESIIRVWTFAWGNKEHLRLLYEACDPIISILNKQFCGEKYKELLEICKKMGILIYDRDK